MPQYATVHISGVFPRQQADDGDGGLRCHAPQRPRQVELIRAAMCAHHLPRLGGLAGQLRTGASTAAFVIWLLYRSVASASLAGWYHVAWCRGLYVPSLAHCST